MEDRKFKVIIVEDVKLELKVQKRFSGMKYPMQKLLGQL